MPLSMLKLFAGRLLALFCVIVPMTSLIGCGKDEDARIVAEAIRKRNKQRQAAAATPQGTMDEKLSAVDAEIRKGNFASAEVLLKPMLVAEPDNPKLIFLSARCLAGRKDLIGAATALETITSDQGQGAYVGALGQSADWLLEAEQFDAAIAKFQRIVEEFDLTLALRKLGAIHNTLGMRHEASKYVMQVAERGEADEVELMNLLTRGAAFIDFYGSNEDTNQRLSKKQFNVARMLRETESFREGIVLTERLSRAFPDDPAIAAFRCRMYNELEEDAKLKEFAAQVPSGTKEQPEYWAALGGWCLRSGKVKESVRCFCEAVSRDQTDLPSYLSLARALRLEDDGAVDTDVQQAILERCERLTDVAQLKRKLQVSQSTAAAIQPMAKLLKQLKRPIESIGWELLSLRRERADQTKLDAMLSNLADVVENLKPLPEGWATCGLSSADWPLPEIATLSGRAPLPGPNALEGKPMLLADIATKVGLDFSYINGDDFRTPEFRLHQMNGGGIGIIDYDGDGWPDIYMTQGGSEVLKASSARTNQLYRNVGGKFFVDVTPLTSTGDRAYGQGVAAADVNQDGFVDLLVANFGRNVHYINNGDGTFETSMLPAAEGSNQWTTSIACGDIDGDHLPEVIEVNYIDDPNVVDTTCVGANDPCPPTAFRPARDRMLSVNDTGEIAVHDFAFDSSPSGRGFGVVIANFDGNNGNDFFVVNDTDPNHLWMGGADGSHTDSADVFGCALSMTGRQQGCMGVASGDFDHNGKLDFHVSNYWNEPSDMYMQGDSGLFTNRTFRTNLSNLTLNGVGWGTQATDLDRDGWLDIMMMNGHVYNADAPATPYRQKHQLFRGSERGFLLEPMQTQGPFWKVPTLGRMLATLDWNRDGRTDFVAGHLEVSMSLLQNETEPGNWIRFVPVGTTSERDAVGAEVRVVAKSNSWTAWVTGGDGIMVTNEPVIDIGLGEVTTVEKVEVDWPTGVTEVFESVQPGHEYLLVEGSGRAVQRAY